MSTRESAFALIRANDYRYVLFNGGGDGQNGRFVSCAL